MEDTQPKVDIITMGCSKNLVDSERLISMFEQRGYSAAHNPEKLTGDIIVINTCGFIGDAKEESINMILECCEHRRRKRKAKPRIYVMGCLSQRYADELPKEIRAVSGWYGKFDWPRLLDDIAAPAPEALAREWERTLTTPSHYAYLKVAEGCNRFCAFCAIPLITGRYKSRPIEEILDEVAELVGRGVKEFNVIAQDLSNYGQDLYGRLTIAELIDRMAQVPGVEWIRLHYAYPAQFPYDLLPVMAKHANVCKYIDIALQHISDKVLANMRRHITGEETRQLLKRMRQEVPGLAIRTTLMVGFPGEGEKEFVELLDFVREQRFERMGAFAYCEEDDTYAAKHLPDEVPQEEKQRRLDELMALQEEIAAERDEALVGQTLDVMLDEYDEGAQMYRGRTQWDSPDVDEEVLIAMPRSDAYPIGAICKVKIEAAQPFALEGRMA